jgi:hypothetical protein
MAYVPLLVRTSSAFYFQQAHSNHRATLRCVFGLPYLSSAMPHETKNARVSS